MVHCGKASAFVRLPGLELEVLEVEGSRLQRRGFPSIAVGGGVKQALGPLSQTSNSSTLQTRKVLPSGWAKPEPSHQNSNSKPPFLER